MTMMNSLSPHTAVAEQPGPAPSAMPQDGASGMSALGLPPDMVMSEAQYAQQIAKMANQESYALPAIVLAVCGGLALLIQAGMGMFAGGPVGAIGMFIIGLVSLGMSVGITFPVVWCIGKASGDDFGTPGGMFLRTAACCAAHTLISFGLVAVLGLLPAAFLSVPVLIIAAVVLLGMSGQQATIFAFACGAITLMLTMMVLGSLTAAVMG